MTRTALEDREPGVYKIMKLNPFVLISFTMSTIHLASRGNLFISSIREDIILSGSLSKR